METPTLTLIKDSFELWYNRHIAKDSPVSIAINYSDTQTLAIKAYHTITIEVKAIGIKNNLSYAASMLTLQENYNHGVTTEQEAKEGLIKKLLVALLDFGR